jgi:hypothetical protein
LKRESKPVSHEPERPLKKRAVLTEERRKNQVSMLKIVFGALILIVSGVIEASAVDQSICASGANVVLYPNGSLKSCALKEPFRSNEITCKGQSLISFYDNGQIETCVLAEPATISGQKCEELKPIDFYQDGKFRSCEKKE